MDPRFNDMQYFEASQEGLSRFAARTFGWMFTGLFITFLVAVATVYTGLFIPLYTTGLIYAFTIGELILVVALSASLQKLQPGTATMLFYLYAALTGVTLSVYFVVYAADTLILAFLLGAVYFGVMAVYGARTQKDLTSWGPLLMGGLVTILVVSVVGMLLSMFLPISFGFGEVLLCAFALIIFMGFTAYDTQKIRYYYEYFSGDEAMLAKSGVIAALNLYLDYINIFIYILRILGRNSRRN